MSTATYLRRQAETMLRLARASYNLEVAEALRLMATDHTRHADEIEFGRRAMPAHMIGRNGVGNGKSENG